MDVIGHIPGQPKLANAFASIIMSKLLTGAFLAVIKSRIHLACLIGKESASVLQVTRIFTVNVKLCVHLVHKELIVSVNLFVDQVTRKNTANVKESAKKKTTFKLILIPVASAYVN